MTFENINWIDLSHDISPDIPTYSGSCGYTHKTVMDYSAHGVKVMKYTMHAGVGTHIDAPSHFEEGEGIDMQDLLLDRCIGYSHVIDLSDKCSESLIFTLEDVYRYEQRFGGIQKNSFVLFYSGWDQYWKEPEKYRNEKENNKMLFPHIHGDVGKYLISKAVKGIGVDTLSPDGPNKEYPIHKQILGSRGVIVENLANLSKLPEKGALFFAPPPKFCLGTEATVRAFAGVLKEG